jgi:hypothetical protein
MSARHGPADSPPLSPACGKRNSDTRFDQWSIFSSCINQDRRLVLNNIKFLNVQSAFEHYNRMLRGSGPAETRARYQGDRLYVEHYHGHTGQFIIGAVFKKGTRDDPDSFLVLLSGPR